MCIYYDIYLPLCVHMLYFDAAKFLNKTVFIGNASVSVVRQWNEYEIVTETRPIKTI